MKSTVLKYGIRGLVIGLVIFGLHLSLLNSFDYGTNEILGHISILLSLSVIYFGLKHYRDHVNDGELSLVKAIIIGVLISILVGIGVGIVDFIYTKYINPEFFDDYAQMLRDQGREDEIMEMSSGIMAAFMWAIVTVYGVIVSIVSGLILQRKN
ncbi:DUF4199 domain-containing protein [Flavobacteriaceae sp. LMIT009]